MIVTKNLQKAFGENHVLRGIDQHIKKGEKVVIIEDVITTARTIFETIEAIKEFEVEVVGVGCIVDRTQGKLDDKLKINSLLKIDPVTYDPNDCPLCKQGLELVKPGSRKGK